MKVSLYDLTQRRALVTRSTARDVVSTISPEISASLDPLELDFEGIEAVSPSFIDELLGSLFGSLGQLQAVRFLSVPTRLSRKFEAIARARRVDISEQPGRSWVIKLPFRRDDAEFTAPTAGSSPPG